MSEPEWTRSEFSLTEPAEASIELTAGNYVCVTPAGKPRRRPTMPRWVCRLMHGAWRTTDGPRCRWCSKCGCAR